MSKIYNSEEVEQILREATTIQKSNSISQEQLLEIAAEVGIPTETLQIAEKVWLERQEKSQKKAKRRKAFIKFHLMPYLTTSVFLLLLNLFTTPLYFWSIYPILGLGLGVITDELSTSQSEIKKRV